MKNYYFGNYIYKNSIIHNLNPLIKLLILALFMSLSNLNFNYYKKTSLIIVLILLIIISKIKFKEFYGSIKTFRFLFLFILVVQLFFNSDGSFNLIPTKYSIVNALYMLLSFFLMISFSAIFTLTTSPSQIAKSLYFFIKPLKKIGVNTKDIAISIIIAIRFIPVLFEEANRIVTSQKLRGLIKKEKGFFNKIKIYTKIDAFIIPLFMRIIYFGNQISITLNYRHNIDNIMILEKIKFSDILFLFTCYFLGILIYIV